MRFVIALCFLAFLIQLMVSPALADDDDGDVWTECEQCASKRNSWCVTSSECVNGKKTAHCETDKWGRSFLTQPIDCFDPETPAYDHDYAVQVLAPAIASSFLDNAEQANECMSNNNPVSAEYDVLYHQTQQCSFIPTSTDVCKAIVAKHKTNNTVLIAYAGTIGAVQYIIQGVQFLLNAVRAPLDKAIPGEVVQYYSDSFHKIYEKDLKERVDALIDNDTNVEILGYSFGGALAASTAIYLAKINNIGPDRLKLYTIGQPRTGDMNFALQLKQNVPNYFRIQNYIDPIPNFPSQYGTLNLIPTYYHSPHHVRYNTSNSKEMTADKAVLCPYADHPDCEPHTGGESTLLTLVQNLHYHTSYFGLDLQNFYTQSQCRQNESLSVSNSSSSSNSKKRRGFG